MARPMVDTECECGNSNCCATVTMRLTTVYMNGMPAQEDGWLSIDAIDSKKGIFIDILLSPQERKRLTWQLVKMFFWRD